MKVRVCLRHFVLYVASSDVKVSVHNVSKSGYTYTTECWGEPLGEKEYLAGLLSRELWRECSGSLEWVVEVAPLVPLYRGWRVLTKRTK